MKQILRAANINKSIQSCQKQRKEQGNYKMQQIQRAYLQAGSSLRGSRSFKSLHNHKNQCIKSQKNEQTNNSIVQLQNAKAIVFLIYKKKRLSFKFDLNTTFDKVIQKIFQQLAFFQREANKLQKAQRKTQLSKIKGFKTLDGNINFDYRFSLEQGVLENSIFLTVFQKPQSKKKYLYKAGNKSNSKYRIERSARLLKYQQSSIKQLYEVYSCLAIGGFSKVYLVRSYTNGKFYAVKCVRRENLQNNSPLQKIEAEREKLQSILNQIELCKNNNHTFIVKLHHAFSTKKFYCLAFQYCPGGQLFYLLKKVKVMSQDDARFYFIQVLYAIQYLHNKNIIYRDLKPENILIDYRGNLKIVDFGLSKTVSSKKEKTYSYCGSAQYMAPQMIMRTGHSFPIDYYSLGTLLYELVTGLPPFYTKDQALLQQSICAQQLSFPRNANLSEDIKDLLLKLLQKDSRFRLGSLAGIKQILCHPWIGKTKALEILNKTLPAPYPPNLKEHNFDPNELGSDQSQFTYDVIRDFCVSKDQQETAIENFYHQSCSYFLLDEKFQKITRDSLKRSSERSSMAKSAKIIKNSENQPFFNYIQAAESKIVDQKVDKQNQKMVQTLTFYVSKKKRKILQNQLNKSINQQQQNSRLADNQGVEFTLSSQKKQNLLKKAVLKGNSPNKKRNPREIRYNLLQQTKRVSQQTNVATKIERYQSNQPITHHQTYHYSHTKSSDKFRNKIVKNRAIQVKDKAAIKSNHINLQYAQQSTQIKPNQYKKIKNNLLYKEIQYIKRLPKPYLKSSLQYIKSSIRADQRYNGLYNSNKNLKKSTKGSFYNQKAFINSENKQNYIDKFNQQMIDCKKLNEIRVKNL